MTREGLVVGFDLGSSVAKVVIATPTGTVMARRSCPQGIDRAAPGLAEQDSGEWWSSLCDLVGQTLASLEDTRRPLIAAVAVSGHFPTLVVADEMGRALAPAMLYSDARADRYVREASDLVGRPLLGDEILPKLLWLRDEFPSGLRRVRRIFNPQDYLVSRLTGSHVLDHHTASRLGGLLDLKRLEWRADVMTALGLSTDVLPDLRRPGDLAGTVTAEASGETGIPAGTPVMTGVGDTLAALIGAGVLRRRDVLMYYGTTATADVCTHDIESYLTAPSSLADGAPYREVAYVLLGPVLPWAASGFGGTDPGPSIEDLDYAAGALGTRPDAAYVLPFFVERPRSAMAVVNRPGIIGLDLGQGRAHLHRALLESFGYAAKAGLDDAGLGAPHSMRFVAAGGGAASDTWRQIVSDTLGVTQTWDLSGDGALGDAKLAAWAAGVGDPFAGDASAWRGAERITTPDPSAVAVHRYRSVIWRRLSAAVGDAYSSPESEGSNLP